MQNRLQVVVSSVKSNSDAIDKHDTSFSFRMMASASIIIIITDVDVGNLFALQAICMRGTENEQQRKNKIEDTDRTHTDVG